MTTSVVIIGINVVYCIYLQLSMQNNYVILYEEIVVYLVLALVALSVFFIFC